MTNKAGKKNIFNSKKARCEGTRLNLAHAPREERIRTAAEASVPAGQQMALRLPSREAPGAEQVFVEELRGSYLWPFQFTEGELRGNDGRRIALLYRIPRSVVVVLTRCSGHGRGCFSPSVCRCCW